MVKDGIFTYTNVEETREEALGDFKHVKSRAEDVQGTAESPRESHKVLKVLLISEELDVENWDGREQSTDDKYNPPQGAVSWLIEPGYKEYHECCRTEEILKSEIYAPPFYIKLAEEFNYHASLNRRTSSK